MRITSFLLSGYIKDKQGAVHLTFFDFFWKVKCRSEADADSNAEGR